MLVIALATFVGTHFLLSHPLRAGFIARLGQNGFMLAYSVVAIFTLGWAVHAFREAHVGAFLWQPGEAHYALASVLMFFASVLFVGSLIGNPDMPAPNAEQLAARTPRGVFAITRHPMMWAFALWSVCHVLVGPRAPVIALGTAIGFLALAGAAAQDRKKAAASPAWRDWMAKTAFMPFSRGAAWPGRIPLIGGTILWLLATWAHPKLGAPVAGIWYWL